MPTYFVQGCSKLSFHFKIPSQSNEKLTPKWILLTGATRKKVVELRLLS